MTPKKHLSNKWLKASVLGCLWASSEIVIGSFLHNLKVPFAGNILTAIGIIILISVAHIWKEKGLFWRSGVVCALMKSISPSAVIFGPMIAIFIEALLMEISVRIFRKNIFSFMLAGTLAMLWNLVFMVGNFIIIYGPNIIDLYANLTVFAQKQLHLATDIYWLPLAVLVVLYIFLGLIAAIFGIYIGRRAARQPVPHESLSVKQVMKIRSRKADTSFPFSFFWLTSNILMLIAELALMSFTRWPFWTVAGCLMLTIWILRYRQTMHLLSKPGFWLSFVILTMISAYVLYNLKNSGSGFFDGIVIGLEMNFRAAIVIIGFSAIGTEFRNPKLRIIFVNSPFWQLPLALEIAFDTLPLMISNLPHVKDVFRKPGRTFHQMVARADYWLEKTELKLNERENVIIIRGTEKTGKTTFLQDIVMQLNNNNISTGGFTAPSVFKNNEHIGYDLIDLSNGQRTVLARTHGNDEMPIVGKFYFSLEGLATGNKILKPENLANVNVVVVDEVGPWELQNQGWAQSLSRLVKSFESPMIWVVRESIVDKVIENWSLKNPLVVDTKKENIDLVCKAILSKRSDKI
ncbi:MAG TPA: nucleoside-triphosphatase [Bacteroidales bacterium]|nr:nucleoside-triphosphatase [Bacteroidales bacterium]